MKISMTILKWLLFGVEIVLLGLFFLITFFAPVMSGVSKIPTIATLAALSFVPALVSGGCFTWKAKGSGRFKRILSAPPLIVYIAVVGLSAVPLVIGWVIGKGMR